VVDVDLGYDQVDRDNVVSFDVFKGPETSRRELVDNLSGLAEH
jgi:hypothetical protein